MTPEILDALRSGWSLPFRGEIFEYAANIDLPRSGYAKPGPFQIGESKYLIEPFRALRNPRIRQVICLKAVQTGGSLIADLWIPYIIEHDPGPTLWLMQDDDAIIKFLADRFFPIMRNTPSLKPWIEAAGRFGIKKDHLVFPHMSVVMGGMNVGNVQSSSRRYVIGDEVWMAGNNGLIRQAKARTTAFAYNKKILIISQAGIEGDDLDLEWKQSDMREWNWQCHSCEKYQVFEMSSKREDGTYAGMKWDTNETTKPNGRWNYPNVGRTARLECFHCGHQVEDSPATRRRLDDTHRYIATNPGADETIAGFHWPAIANVDISFASVVVAYLQAKVQADENGYTLPLQEFNQKILAKPWRLHGQEDWSPIETESYDVNAAWPDEKYRFLIVDCQKELKKFYVGVYACSLAGEDRELARETALSFDDIAAIQKKWNVKDQRVFLDCGYQMSRVLRECVQRGHKGSVVIGGRKKLVWLCWTGLKGSGQETFGHIHPKTKVQENRMYSPRKFYDVCEGTNLRLPRAPYYEWSNLHCKDVARSRRDGDSGMPKFLTLPDTLPASDAWSFNAQMRSERRQVEYKNGKKRAIWLPIKETNPNHEWDKVAMLQAVKSICGIIGGVNHEEEQEQAA
jgi:hypothetical protein